MSATEKSNRPVQIVTDSTSDLPEHKLRGLPITVIPLSVEIEGEVFRDGIDLSRAEFLARLRAGAVPRTSQPSVGAFQEVYSRLLADGVDVVSVHIASQFSGTMNSALTAANENDDGRVAVIDSGTLSMALGFLALEAAEMARDGKPANEIAEYLERRKRDQRLYATLETLEYLQRGGRIGRAAALLGSALQLKPIVQVRDGEVVPVERVRTYRRALDRLASIAEELTPFDNLAVMHLDAERECERLIERIQRLQPETEIVTGQIGTVIGVYGGPGLVGFAGLRSENR
jgi:DegV family protein with EDD domain